jgi:hypothetical protein
MQTFLPYPSFELSAKVLDTKRLGKQRVETKQILTALDYKRIGGKYGWQNHPATLMWEGHYDLLACYGAVICMEWRSRGYKDTLLPWFEARHLTRSEDFNPSWVGDEAFHASHRSNLLRKDPEYYGKFGWAEPPDLPYVWPVTKAK